jgi:hypothetical protein
MITISRGSLAAAVGDVVIAAVMIDGLIRHAGVIALRATVTGSHTATSAALRHPRTTTETVGLFWLGVRPLQLSVIPLQAFQIGRVLRRDARPSAGIDLGLPTPLAHRLIDLRSGRE